MGCILSVTVVPNARAYRVRREKSRDIVRVHVLAKAQKGEANRDLLSFLSMHFKSPTIILGHRSRHKKISVGDEKEEVTEVLQNLEINFP